MAINDSSSGSSGDNTSSTSGVLPIDTLSLVINVEVNKSTAKLRNFTRQLAETNTVVSQSNATFAQFASYLEKVQIVNRTTTTSIARTSAEATKATEETSKAVESSTKALSNLGSFATIGKIYFFFNYFKRIGEAISSIIQKGIDFNETLNLWQVSMRSNINEARTFISTMNDAYGIAEDTAMKAEATFNNMLSSLGSMSSEVSSQISESLLQMSVDFASLYNTSLDDAITKFESVLSGQG